MNELQNEEKPSSKKEFAKIFLLLVLLVGIIIFVIDGVVVSIKNIVVMEGQEPKIEYRNMVQIDEASIEFYQNEKQRYIFVETISQDLYKIKPSDMKVIKSDKKYFEIGKAYRVYDGIEKEFDEGYYLFVPEDQYTQYAKNLEKFSIQ